MQSPPKKLSLTALATAQQHGCGGLQHISLLSGLQPPAKDQGRIQKLRLKMLLSRDVPKPQHCLEELPPVPAWAREPWGTALGCGGWQGQPPRPLFFSHQSSAGQHCAAGRGVTVLLSRGKVAAVAALLAQELGSACGIALPSQHGTRAGVSRTDSLWPTFSLCCQPHGLWLTRTPGTARPTRLVPNTQDRASTKVGSGSSFPVLPSQFQKPRRESERKTR